MMLNSRIPRQIIGRLLLAVAVYAFFAVRDAGFRGITNLYPLFDGFAFIGLVALGLSATMIAGELDLSVASVATVAGIIAVKLVGWGLVPCVVVAVSICTVFGAIQGFVISRLKISSLVFTVGTMIGGSGLAYIISHENAVAMSVAHLDVSDKVGGKIWVFSPFSLTTIGVFIVVGLFLAMNRYGREIFAIGGGRVEAVSAGVSVVRPIVIAFALSAGLAGLAGVLVSLEAGAADPGGFPTLLLDGVTAALVGGVSLYGGEGSVVGVAIGVMTLQILVSGISIEGAPFYVQSLATGALLLAVLILEATAERSGFGAGLRRLRGRLSGTVPARGHV